jgi:hypothetical protein
MVVHGPLAASVGTLTDMAGIERVVRIDRAAA